uniref:MamL-1 domain-containing protein n=1 Tax=Rhabditophanes sp. KR3021 TaxID=114890 RepID=A0AC35U360_9BILA
MFPNQQGHPSSYSGGPVTQANMAAYHHQQQQGMQPSPLYPGGGTPGYGIPPNGYMSGNGPFQGGQRISSNIQHINSMNNPGACNYGPGTSGPPTTLHQQQMMNGGQQRIGWESEGRPGHSQFYNGMGQMTVQQQQAAHQQSFIQQQQQQNSNQMILQQQQMHHANALQHQQVQKNMSASLKRKNSGQNVAERAPKQFMGSMVNTANSVPFSQQNPGYGVINGGPSPMYQQTSHEMPSSNFPVNNQQMQQQQVLNNQMVKKEYMATPNPSPYNGNFENQNSQQQWGVKRPPSQNEQMRAEVRNNLQAKQHMNTNNLPLVRPPPTPPSQGISLFQGV